MSKNEQTIIFSEEAIASEEFIAKMDEQIIFLEEKPEKITPLNSSESVKEYQYKPERIRTQKNTLTGQYYQALLRKNPMIWLLIIGGILGCYFSVSIISEMCGGNLGLWFQKWWWIPLSTVIIGPIAIVFFALIIPLIPYILYGAFYVLISLGS